jgi:hypothetical protein
LLQLKRMQKSLLALCLAFTGCGSCSDASSASPATPPPPAAETKPSPKPALPTVSDNAAPDPKPDPERKDPMHDRAVKLDSNGDGIISDEERADAIHRRAVALHARLDKDGDGKVTQAELDAAGRIAHRLGDTSKIDTNHDGEISVEEMEAALNARYQQWKTTHDSGSPVKP